MAYRAIKQLIFKAYIYIPRSTSKIDGVEELFMELAKSGPKTEEKSWYDKGNSE